MNKFSAKKCQDDSGRRFDSQGERDCFFYLRLLEKAGEIEIIQQQAQTYLTDAEIGYRADFLVRDLKICEDVWVEYKGFEQPEWLLKKKLWKYYGPGRLRIYKGRGLRIFLAEEIIPRGRKTKC